MQRSASGGRGSTKFVYDGDDVIVDDNGNGNKTTYLNADGIDNKLKMKAGSDPSKYFVTDHLGSTIGLAGADGNVSNPTSYDSFGNTTSTLPTRYRFTGREYDEFSGLYHYRARSYDPKTGRFMSEDPIGLAGGINQFAYVGNNPLNFSDPSGLFPTAGEMADGLDGLVNRGKGALNADYDTFGWYGKFGIDYYVGASTDVLKLIYDPLKLGRGFGCAFYGEGVPWWQRGFMVIGDIGRAFAIAGAVSSVVSRVAGLVGGDTALLQAHVTRAARRVDSLGDAAFTRKQLAAIQNNPSLRPMFRGNRIDVMTREMVKGDSRLSHLTSNYSKGPDFVDSVSGKWWDMTTAGQWESHVNKYGPNGTFLNTK